MHALSLRLRPQDLESDRGIINMHSIIVDEWGKYYLNY